MLPLILAALPALAAQQPDVEVCPVDPAAESSEEAYWGWEYHASVWSQYVWRGIVLNDEAVLQPDLFVYRGFPDGSYLGAGLWWSQDLTDVAGDRGEIGEFDPFFEWGWSGDDLTVAAGAVAYTFPDSGAPNTAEAYIVCEGSLGPVRPRAELWVDPIEADGFYLRGAVLCEHELAAGWSFCWQAWASAMDRNYADYNIGARTAGLGDAGAALQVGFQVSESARLDLSLQASTQIESAYRTALTDPDPFWFGLLWTQEF